MMLHNYSQLPVISSPKTIVGYISWVTIGNKIANGIISDKVCDYLSKDVAILDYEKPLLEAIKIVIDKEFAIVQKSDKSISGIVTIADISEQFLSIYQKQLPHLDSLYLPPINAGHQSPIYLLSLYNCCS